MTVDPRIVDAVQRRMSRTAAQVHQEMSRGLTSLATIASTAPFVGFLGTVLGMMNSFRGTSGDRTAIMAAFARILSESLFPTALGLLIAIPSLWFYRYARTRVAAFDIEMANASLHLANFPLQRR